MKHYYRDQLNRLKNSEYCKSILLNDNDGNITNYLNLNSESIPELIKFLNKELKRLKKGSK